MSLQSEVQGEPRSAQRYFPTSNRAGESEAVLAVAECDVAPFEFRSFSGWEADGMGGLAWSARGGHALADATGNPGQAEMQTERDFLHQAELAAAREAGEQEGRRQLRVELEAEMRGMVTQERGRLVATAKQFTDTRANYFAEVEQQVVKLSLAIAARVLHRESAVDPMLLTGVVRVALEKMADRSGVVLRVPGKDVDAWEQIFQEMEVSGRPRVLQDTRLTAGECVLESTMGTVELGVKAQLEEIEKGFLDLLNQRPGA